MTDIYISARRGAGAPAEILYGTVTFKPTLAHSRSTSIVLPAPTTYDLVNGEVLATNVQPTPEPVEGKIEWAYEVTFKDRHSKTYSFLVGVPDSTTQVNFTSLPRYYETRPPLFGAGPKGEPGEAATVEVGTVNGGTAASVTNSGTNTDAVLDFVLPQGPQGPSGVGVTTLTDNISATEPPSFYPEGISHTRITSASAMGDWGGFRGVVVTTRKTSYVEQTFTGSTGEGTRVRTSNNGTSWTPFQKYASADLATSTTNGLMPSSDKAKLDANNTLVGDSKSFGDSATTYPEGVSVTTASTQTGWPNVRTDGAESRDSITTFRARGVPGGSLQLITDYYRPSTSPIYFRRSDSAGAWSTPEKIITDTALSSRIKSYNISDSGASLTAATDASDAISAWLDTIPSGSIVYMDTGSQISLTKEVAVTKPLTFVDLNVKAGAQGVCFRVTVDDVHFQGCEFTGTGTATYKANAAFIWFQGADPGNKISNFTVSDSKFRDMPDKAIHFSYCYNAHVTRVDVDNFCYAGVNFSGCEYHSVTYSRIGNAVHRTNTNSYGIASSDGLNTAEARARDGYFAFNHLYNIPDWEGIDSHGGYRMVVLGNTFKGVKRAICMLEGNSPREYGANQTTIIGNVIDGAGAISTTGITLAGGTLDSNFTPDPNRLGDGTVVGNAVYNCTTPAVLARLDWNKTNVSGNVGIGDGHDKGWLEFGLSEYSSGWFPNSSYKPRYRYEKGNGKTTVHIEGVLSRTSGVNADLLQLPADLFPGYAKTIGPTSTTTQGSGILEVTASGKLRFIFAGGVETGNLSITCTYTF